MRCDFLIDVYAFGSSTLEGDDATDTILKMYNDLKRNDIRFVLISVLVVSMYNIVDIRKLTDIIQIPIIGISYNLSLGLEDAIRHSFQNSYESKLVAYRKLGPREKITLNNSHVVYVRKEGCNLNDV